MKKLLLKTALLLATLSAPLTQAQPVIPAGDVMGNPGSSANVPVGTPPASLAIPTINGTPATGDCTSWISATQVGDAGQPCGSGGGSIAFASPDGSLTVSGSGTPSITAVVDPTNINFSAGTLPITALPGNPCDTALVVDINPYGTNPAGQNNAPFIDNVNVPANTIFLLKAQGAPAQNGFWETPATFGGTATWHRPSCSQSGSSTQLVPGQAVTISAGGAYHGTTWSLNTFIPGQITVDTTIQQWGEISGNGSGGDTFDLCTNWNTSATCGDTIRGAGNVTWSGSGNAVTLPVTLPSGMVGANIIVGGLGPSGCGDTRLFYQVDTTSQGTGVTPGDIFVGNEGTFSSPCWLQTTVTEVVSATVASAGTSCPSAAATSAAQNTTTGVWTSTNTFAANEVVYLTGTPPGGFATNTPYYVMSTNLSGSQFELSSTPYTAGSPFYVPKIPSSSSASVTITQGAILQGTTGITNAGGPAAYQVVVAPSNGSGGVANPISVLQGFTCTTSANCTVNTYYTGYTQGNVVYLQNPQGNAANPVEPMVSLASTSYASTPSTVTSCTGVTLNLSMGIGQELQNSVLRSQVNPIVSGVYSVAPTGTLTTASTQSVIHMTGSGQRSGFAAGATSGTLSAIGFHPALWPNATGSYTLTFYNVTATGAGAGTLLGTETHTATLTNGSGAVTWTGGLANAATTYVLVNGECNLGGNTCPTFPIQDQSGWNNCFLSSPPSNCRNMAFYGTPLQTTVTAISGTTVTLATTPTTPVNNLPERYAVGHDDAPTWNNMLTATAAYPGLKVSLDPSKAYGIYSQLVIPGGSSGTIHNHAASWMIDCQESWITALAPMTNMMLDNGDYWSGYPSIVEYCNLDGFGQAQNIINSSAGERTWFKNYEIDPVPTTNNFWQLSTDFLVTYDIASIILENVAYNSCPETGMTFFTILVQPTAPVCASFGLFMPTSDTDTTVTNFTSEGADLAGIWTEEGATQMSSPEHVHGNAFGDYVIGSFIGGAQCGYGPFDNCGGEIEVSGNIESDGQVPGVPAITLGGYGGTSLGDAWYAGASSNGHPGVMITGVYSKFNRVGAGACPQAANTSTTNCVYVSPTLSNSGSVNTISMGTTNNSVTNFPVPAVNGFWNPTSTGATNLNIVEFDASSTGTPGQRRFSTDPTGGVVIYGTGASNTLGQTYYVNNGYNRIQSGATTTATYTDTLPPVTGTVGVGTGTFTSGDCVQYSGTNGGQQDSGVACTSLNPLILQSALPFIYPPAGYMDAAGNFIIGAQPPAGATVYFSSNTAGTGINMTFNAPTLAGTSAGAGAADVGRVLTIYDTGSSSYKTAIITTFGTSTSATVTLNNTLVTACTVGSPCPITVQWLSGPVYTAPNAAGAGSVTYPAPLPVTYPNAYIYFQGSAPTPSAGWFYCQGSYFTVFACYNSKYTPPGQPEVGSTTAFSPALTPAVYTPTPALIEGPAQTIGASALGVNGEIDFNYQVTANNGGSRLYDLEYNTSLVATTTLTTTTAGGIIGSMTNTGIATSQVTSTGTNSAVTRTSVASTTSYPFQLLVDVATNSTDWAVVERYSDKLYPQN